MLALDRVSQRNLVLLAPVSQRNLVLLAPGRDAKLGALPRLIRGSSFQSIQWHREILLFRHARRSPKSGSQDRGIVTIRHYAVRSMIGTKWSIC